MRKIAVLGMDPSLRNWGLAEATLDLDAECLTTPIISTIHTQVLKTKQVRQNSDDLATAEQLATTAIEAAKRAKVVFVEVPVGSQSARAMASYGVCVGVLGAIRALGVQLIEVTPLEVKLAFTGKRTATKEEMILRAVELYPEANWPRQKGKVVDRAEHMADAIAAIHAGVNTPMFQQLLRLYAA